MEMHPVEVPTGMVVTIKVHSRQIENARFYPLFRMNTNACIPCIEFSCTAVVNAMMLSFHCGFLLLTAAVI